MYREGILPSGKPMLSTVNVEAAAPGTTFACASCHLRSGFGALYENVYTPPIVGRKLFEPQYSVYKGFVQDKAPPVRPAYSDAALKEAILNGRNSAGRPLNDVMPRYILDDRDAAILIEYLKSLSAETSPGVTETDLHFATVVAEDASQEERQALLTPLEYFITNHNGQVEFYSTARGGKSRLMAEQMLGSGDLAGRKLTMSVWSLKGAPETWRRQLEEYNGKEPVFAVLGGIAKGDWKPVHRFCEDNHIPCLFPNTDLPVLSEKDWYTLYLSKGYFQEGESTAHYLNARLARTAKNDIVQIVRTSEEGGALSAGFQQAWRGHGHPAPVTITLRAGESLTAELLRRIVSKHKPAALIVWDDAKVLPLLESLAGRKAGPPPLVFMSSRYLGDRIWTLKERIRDFVYLTYPFSFSPYIIPKAAGMGQQQKLQNDLLTTVGRADVQLKENSQRIMSLTNALTQLLPKALSEMKGNYYRDYLLDAFDIMMDQQYPLFGRLSFAQGRRYAAQGCYIVQLSKEKTPRLVKKSDWDIQ